ncbi:MAG: hypothetical protein ABI847_02840 [Anaerolineales bacterium]
MSLPGSLEPGSVDLHRIVLDTVTANGLSAELSQAIRRACAAALAEQGIVLSHPESDRLSARVARSVLERMLAGGL